MCFSNRQLFVLSGAFVAYVANLKANIRWKIHINRLTTYILNRFNRGLNGAWKLVFFSFFFFLLNISVCSEIEDEIHKNYTYQRRQNHVHCSSKSMQRADTIGCHQQCNPSARHCQLEMDSQLSIPSLYKDILSNKCLTRGQETKAEKSSGFIHG